MFDSIATLAVAQNMRELYRLVLVDTPLAPYFSENLTHEDLDDMNIEIMRNTLYKAYLDDFAAFCQKLGGTTAEIMGDMLAFEVRRGREVPGLRRGRRCSTVARARLQLVGMLTEWWSSILDGPLCLDCHLLAAGPHAWPNPHNPSNCTLQTDRRALNITLNSIGTELTREDRKKLYSNFGLLYPHGHNELAMAEDFDQIRAAMEKVPAYSSIFSKVRRRTGACRDRATGQGG